MAASSENSEKVADAPRGNWADRFLPSWALPYARLARFDRPIGWWLLMWPCWWSTMLAMDSVDGRPLPVLPILILFMIGAIVMRGAGCTFNDIVDRNIDAQVARTRSRPIPSGQVSLVGALIFMVALGLIGLLILIQFDSFTILLGLASLGTVVIYPFLKRFTNWPQIGLGISFSWGALMGWSALFGAVDPPAIVLYIGCIFWVIGYDTIYALQDKEDDTLAGVRSTARLFGPHAKRLIVFSFVCTTALFGVAFILAEAGIAAFVGLFLGAIHFFWQVKTLDPEDPERCLKIFRSNRDYGWILFAGIVLDAALTAY